MKKMILLLLLSIMLILPINVQALSVDKNNLTIAKNNSENIILYANVETEITEISFTLVYTSYDLPGYFYVESGLSDNNPGGPVHKIAFSEPVSGNIKLGSIKTSVVSNPKDTAGTINIHKATALTESGETINLTSQMINVTVETTQKTENEEETTNNNQQEETSTKTETVNKPKEEEKTKEKEEKEETTTSSGMLEKIESDMVNIQLKDNVYEYTIYVESNVEELDLKPIAKDKKYKVEISNQKISELEDNTITITVKDGDKTEEYKIKVKTKAEIEEIEIDESEFESTYKYKGKWITLIIILTVTLFAGLILTKKK